MIDKQKIRGAFKWQILNISVQAILEIAFIMISARVLPIEVHGAFAILYAFVFFMTISSEAGVSSALIQRKKVNAKHISTAFYSTLGISLILFVLIYLFSNTISTFYEQKIESEEIRWAALIFVFVTIGKVPESFLIRSFRYKELFIARSLSFFIGSILVMYLLAINDFGIYALIIGFMTTQGLTSIGFFLWSRPSFRLSFGRKEFLDLYYFGSSFTLLRIVNYLSSQIDKLMMGKYLPLATLSLYEKGQYITKMPPKYIGNIIDSIMFSTFSKIEGKGIKKGYLLKIISVIFSISSYFTILLYFNSSIAVKSILGKDWIDVIPFMEILVLSIPAIILARVGDIVVRSENKMFRSLPIKITFLSILLLSIFSFKDSNYLTLTASIVVSYWVHALLMLFLALSILESLYLRFFKMLFVIIGLGIILVLKYQAMSHFFQNEWIFLFLNLLTDVLIIAGNTYIFRNNTYVKGIIKTLRSTKMR